MTHPDLDPLLQEPHQQDPRFFTALSLRQRWQLLMGLHTTLLDYTSASFSPPGLETQHLRLPVRQLTLPLVQLMDALVTAECELDQLAWIEELDVEFSEQEAAACDQVLTIPESTALLHQLLSRGLAFLAPCDLSEEDKV